jgi:hypothetical protein
MGARIGPTMSAPKRSKAKKVLDEELEEPSRDSRGFEALAELTSSDVIAQVKMGMSRASDSDEISEEPPY